ncbi:MAG: hypothetical protein RQ754_09030 [Desulfuromonadales bacterium]|nr:hypothetical protein [Desulfuromonadales bacterium]
MGDNNQVGEKLLSNGLCLRFYDQSNRYYGDFHRVFISVEAFLSGQPDLPEELQAAASSLHETVIFRKVLERMGVTSDRLAATIDELIEDFLAASGDYLCRRDMPELLLKKYHAEKGRRRKPVVFGR